MALSFHENFPAHASMTGQTVLHDFNALIRNGRAALGSGPVGGSAFRLCAALLVLRNQPHLTGELGCFEARIDPQLAIDVAHILVDGMAR